MRNFSLTLIIVILISGCTQIITAPIKVVGAVAGAAIDVTAAGVSAIAGSDDKDK